MGEKLWDCDDTRPPHSLYKKWDWTGLQWMGEKLWDCDDTRPPHSLYKKWDWSGKSFHSAKDPVIPNHLI